MSLDITPLVPVGQQTIQSYGDGEFRVSNVVYNGSVIVFTDKCISWDCSNINAINIDALSSVINAENKPEILIVGCGEKFTRTPDELSQELKAHGIVLEWMATGAACRTYNILAIEGRTVAAAMIAID